MSLAPGTRLGPYEVTAQIDVGGMGEVWRATDTNLGRDVAIKVLPDAFAQDAERLARFEREAKTLASLNHPNIAAIYGLEKADGARALVMELVEGPTLADRIGRGQIPLDEALPIARQIADALEAAHEQGIIHRDLKPANVKVRDDGTVKVLDFGLAKAMEQAGAGVDISRSPTITSPAMTQQGVILGTAAYMSPEQARGKAVDKRTDIWSFGCVLYEMVTGKRLFGGEDLTETIARVVKEQPDLSAAPSSLRRLLQKCLDKDPRRRLRDIGDAWELLENESVASVPRSRRREDKRLAWILVASAMVAVVLLGLVALGPLGARTAEMSLTIVDIVTPPTTSPSSFALSPDGRTVAFVANGDRGAQLWVRSLDQGNARPLDGTLGASYPFWAPDGKSIGFYADSRIMRIGVEGGPPAPIVAATNFRGAAWSTHGVIVFAALGGVGGLQRIDANGGIPKSLTSLAKGQLNHRWPQMLPGGRRFLYQALKPTAETEGIYVGSLDGENPIRVFADGSHAVYVEPGYVLRVLRGVLQAYSFDTKTAMVSGNPIVVAQPVGVQGNGLGAFSAASTGVVAYRAVAENLRQLQWFDRSGKRLGSLGGIDDGALANPSISPHGDRVAVDRFDQGNIDLWMLNIGHAQSARVTFDPALDQKAVWSSDGTRVAFFSNRGGNFRVFEKPADVGGGERELFGSGLATGPTDWSGKFLLYSLIGESGTSDLSARAVEATQDTIPIARGPAEETQGQFSPDGRWVAYTSTQDGHPEIYVQPFPPTGAKSQISVSGGSYPRWAPDGRELYFVAPDRRLMAASIRGGSAQATIPLFATEMAQVGTNLYDEGVFSTQQYDVAPDGRFLINVDVTQERVLPINLVFNWLARPKPNRTP